MLLSYKWVRYEHSMWTFVTNSYVYPYYIEHHYINYIILLPCRVKRLIRLFAEIARPEDGRMHLFNIPLPLWIEVDVHVIIFAAYVKRNVLYVCKTLNIMIK